MFSGLQNFTRLSIRVRVSWPLSKFPFWVKLPFRGGRHRKISPKAPDHFGPALSITGIWNFWVINCMKWDTRSCRPVLIGGPGWGRLFWGAHTTSEKKRADWNFFWTCAHPHPTCWTALSYKRGEKVTNERSCLPPPPQLYSPSPHWSGWWPLVNLQAWDPSTTTTTRPHLTAAYLSTPWKT